MSRCITEIVDFPTEITVLWQEPTHQVKIMIAFIPILGLTFLSLVDAVPATGSDKLHEQMTADEVRQLFNAEPHEVPDYDVVPIQWPRLHKRAHGSNTRIRVDAFDRNIKLWLNPVEGVLVGKDTPVYYAKSGSGKNSPVSYIVIANAMAIIGDVFEDREKQASLIVKRSASGTNLISGYIGSEGWTVRPVPERFRRQLNATYPKSDDEMKDIIDGNYEAEHHVIYKNPEVSDEADYITQPIRDDILNNKATRSKRSSPDVIYPQIMVMVDHATFKRYNEYIYDLLEYMVPFWNGVDLRYRSLESPKVRLNIAGIMIATDANAFSFVTKNKVNADTMNINGALEALSLYMPSIKQYFPLDSYDIAVAMSPYSMCSPVTGGLCKPGTLGLAYVSGACDIRNFGILKSLSVTVIQDKGGFDGMHTAAHELGHLFGASHDGQDGSLCSGAVGNIMSSTPVLTEHTADWSPCTTDAFNKFFNVGNPKCLYNKPKTTSPLPRVLPGKFMSADQQCANIEGTKSCPLEENICIRLRCIYKPDKRYCLDVGDAAADGTTCAKNKICIHGKCVAEKDIV